MHPKRAVAVMLVVLAALTLQSADAQGQGNVVQGCVNDRSGRVRLVDPGDLCREHETAVTWPASAAGGGLRVVDSTGQVVGPLMWQNSVPGLVTGIHQVAVKIGGRFFVLQVGPSGFTEGLYPSFLYENADCSTGRKYLQAWPESFFQPVHQEAGFAYYPQEPYQIRENLYDSGFFCQPKGGILTGEAAPIDLSSLGFVPPFHVE